MSVLENVVMEKPPIWETKHQQDGLPFCLNMYSYHMVPPRLWPLLQDWTGASEHSMGVKRLHSTVKENLVELPVLYTVADTSF